MRLLLALTLSLSLLLSGCPVDDVVARSRCDGGCADAP
jgi:hypothetical protein